MALLAAIALIAGASIAYEILLTRLFSILLWHHFAYMIISVALLGIGASGTFLAFAREFLAPRFTAVFAGCAVLFAVSVVAGFAVAQRVPFNPLEVIWDLRQQLYLAQLYLLLALPFFAVGIAIGLAFTRFAERIPALYAADLLGAGWGRSSLWRCYSSPRHRQACASSAGSALPLQRSPRGPVPRAGRRLRLSP
jgi:hypothetical protein